MKRLTVIMAFALAGCLAGCISEKGGGEGPAQWVEVGDRVPQFTLGELSSPEAFEGRKSLIVFFNTWCPDCQREMPVINDACRQLPDLQAIAISRGETLEQQAIEQWAPEMQYYPDPNKEIFNLFAESTVPRVYLIDETGVVAWMAIEELPDPNNFKQLIYEILY